MQMVKLGKKGLKCLFLQIARACTAAARMGAHLYGKLLQDMQVMPPAMALVHVLDEK